MPRHSCLQATVLENRSAGESNRTLTLLTKEQGIVHAMLYGGPRSRLRGQVSPWNSGTAWLYTDTPRGGGSPRVKLTDFDVRSYHESFRSDLHKAWAASLAAETVVRTRCAGDSARCWTLLNGFLDGLELCRTAEQGKAGLLRFLWRYLSLLGVQPDFACVHCGRAPHRTEHVRFVQQERGFACADCSDGRAPEISAGALQYLRGITELPPAEARALPLTDESLSQLRGIIFFLTEQAVGSPLASLASGAGIL